MIQEFTANSFLDDNECPAGGNAYGPGFCITWQNGPLGRDADRVQCNGAFVETVLLAVKGRLEFYQASKFNCAENAEAVLHIEAALEHLASRTAKREARKVEGTHEV